MIEPKRTPGWDKQAINGIARDHYGSLDAMFAAHGWDRDGRTVGQIAPTRVVETYGNVEAFVETHGNGAAANPLLNPLATIENDPPDVWLTSFYGFAPRNWGFLGFTEERTRQSFLERSKPGALVVVYGATGASRQERGHILGIEQVSHQTGKAEEFMEPMAWRIKQADVGRRGKWELAVRAIRAWRVTPETRPLVGEFANETYTAGRAQVIGAQGMKLTAREARKILDLDLVEVPVFGGNGDIAEVAGAALEILRPSRPGPVAQSSYMVRESEGPKHLYILRLEGNGDHFMGRDIAGRAIVKVGFSRSPDTRAADHNRGLPNCAFRWAVERSTFTEGREAYPSSRHAIAGENEMKRLLDKEAESLGGEFFLADSRAIERAWEQGKAKAEGA